MNELWISAHVHIFKKWWTQMSFKFIWLNNIFDRSQYPTQMKLQLKINLILPEHMIRFIIVECDMQFKTASAYNIKNLFRDKINSWKIKKSGEVYTSNWKIKKRHCWREKRGAMMENDLKNRRKQIQTVDLNFDVCCFRLLNVSTF